MALIFSAISIIIICGLMMIQNYYVYLVGRVLMGFSIGIKIVASLRMVEEYTPQSFFPFLSNLMYASIALGALISSSFPYDNPDTYIQNWRWPLAANLFVNVFLLLSLVYVIRCDSPKFYLQRNDDDRTREAISKIYRADFVWQVDEIYKYMSRSICTLTTSQTFWEAFVTDPNVRRASWVSILLVFFQGRSECVFIYSRILIVHYLQFRKENPHYTDS
jgi:MFS family permease